MKKSNEPQVLRGEIYYATLSSPFGSEQGGIRPVLIVQNDVGNKHAPTTIIAPITSRVSKHKLPTHVEVGCEGGLTSCGLILLEQVRTIDKLRLRQKVGELAPERMAEVDKALRVSLGLA